MAAPSTNTQSGHQFVIKVFTSTTFCGIVDYLDNDNLYLYSFQDFVQSGFTEMRDTIV